MELRKRSIESEFGACVDSAFPEISDRALLISVQGRGVNLYYIGSAEGHEYPDLQVGDEVNPRPFFVLS